MKFCKKCKHTYEDTQEICTNCKNRKPLTEITDSNTPVYLISADGFERERIQTALTDNGIPNDSVIKEEDIMPEAVKYPQGRVYPLRQKIIYSAKSSLL